MRGIRPIFAALNRVGTYLENDVLRKDVLDTSNLVLGLAFRKLRWRRAAAQNLAKRRNLRDLCQLLCVRRLLLSS